MELFVRLHFVCSVTVSMLPLYVLLYIFLAFFLLFHLMFLLANPCTRVYAVVIYSKLAYLVCMWDRERECERGDHSMDASILATWWFPFSIKISLYKCVFCICRCNRIYQCEIPSEANAGNEVHIHSTYVPASYIHFVAIWSMEKSGN